MFCPNCGIEDNRSNQYCRSCGSDLRPVRRAITHIDHLTASAMSARDEIGSAVAAKILESRSMDELGTVAESVLPEIEKFLESPAERRLRRMRDGMIISSVGIGVSVGFLLAAIFAEPDLMFFAALGFVAFFIGIGFIINGYFLTVPRENIHTGRDMPALTGSVGEETAELIMPEEGRPLFSSVTEGTTRHLTKTGGIED